MGTLQIHGWVATCLLGYSYFLIGAYPIVYFSERVGDNSVEAIGAIGAAVGAQEHCSCRKHTFHAVADLHFFKSYYLTSAFPLLYKCLPITFPSERIGIGRPVEDMAV